MGFRQDLILYRLRLNYLIDNDGLQSELLFLASKATVSTTGSMLPVFTGAQIRFRCFGGAEFRGKVPRVGFEP